MIYHFDQFELDVARFELRQEGAVQQLEPQVFTVLAYLVEHRERLVPRNELFEKLWDGRVVTDSVLTSRIKSARQALGDSGKTQQFIKTIHGKGFRFIADVRFTDGLAQETNTELARLRWLLVVARDGMDSVRSPVERTACICRRCAAQLDSAVLTQPETKTLGRISAEPSG